MQQITLRNVRQNNLQIPRLNIPLQEVVIFCGPSGSGKSSLAIDTILAEGQRRCVEALRSSIRLDEKRLPRPAVESIEGLPPTWEEREEEEGDQNEGGEESEEEEMDREEGEDDGKTEEKQEVGEEKEEEVGSKLLAFSLILLIFVLFL